MPTKSTSPYQPMRSLTTDELRTLRTSIETHGILEPIIVDEKGEIIDGHHRSKIGAQLGIEVPKRVMKALTGEEKMATAKTLNWARRQLSVEERREHIGEALKADPKVSNREIARRTGFDDKTVAAVRKSLVESAELPQTDKTVGADGKARAATRRPKPEPQLPEEIVEAVTSPAVAAILSETGEPEDAPTLAEHVIDGINAIVESIKEIEVELKGAGLEPEEWARIAEGLGVIRSAVDKVGIPT